MPHVLVVDHADRRAFEPLRSERTQIVESEALLPSWITGPGRGHGWRSAKTGEFPGWLAQQLLKLAVADVRDEDVLIVCDADIAFLSRFDPRDALVLDGRLPIPHVAFADDDHRSWRRAACGLLGLPDDQAAVTYVGNVVPLWRELIVAMRSRIEATTGVSWQHAILRTRDVAELFLYGMFVERVVGLDAARHVPAPHDVIAPSWGCRMTSPAEAVAFVDAVTAPRVGVMFHSKDQVPVAWYEAAVRDRLARELALAAPPAP